MKIREYKVETLALIVRFESSNADADFYQLFEAIDLRLLDEQIWNQYGLSDEDEVPQAPGRVVLPNL